MKKKIFGLTFIVILFLTSLFSVNVSKSEKNNDFQLKNILAISSAKAEYPNGGCTCGMFSSQVCCVIHYSFNEWKYIYGYPY